MISTTIFPVVLTLVLKIVNYKKWQQIEQKLKTLHWINFLKSDNAKREGKSGQ
jgi:hypothetical protein